MQINHSLNSLSQYVKFNSNEENENSKNQEQNTLMQDPAVEVNISKEAKEKSNISSQNNSQAPAPDQALNAQNSTQQDNYDSENKLAELIQKLAEIQAKIVKLSGKMPNADEEQIKSIESQIATLNVQASSIQAQIQELQNQQT